MVTLLLELELKRVYRLNLQHVNTFQLSETPSVAALPILPCSNEAILLCSKLFYCALLFETVNKKECCLARVPCETSETLDPKHSSCSVSHTVQTL